MVQHGLRTLRGHGARPPQIACLPLVRCFSPLQKVLLAAAPGRPVLSSRWRNLATGRGVHAGRSLARARRLPVPRGANGGRRLRYDGVPESSKDAEPGDRLLVQQLGPFWRYFTTRACHRLAKRTPASPSDCAVVSVDGGRPDLVSVIPAETRVRFVIESLWREMDP